MRIGGFETNPGLDLSQVRSIKACQMSIPVGDRLPMIINAKDAAGKDLGTFIDGMHGILPCEK
jgi:hypothetical protein